MKYIGSAVAGLTNTQLAAGKGTYVDDVQLPGMTYMAVLRSPHAHARIRGVDTAAARALPGVVYVITADEVVANMRPIPEAWNTREIGAKGVTWYSLCAERVRFVGESWPKTATPPRAPCR
jgi:carbon-monoxide dehydrogenase large subunit